MKKRYGWTISSFNDLLEDISRKHISPDTAERSIVSYLKSNEFLKYIFNPPEDVERSELQKETKDMYVLMCHRRVMKTISNAVIETMYEDFDDFDRSVAVFLNTASMAAISASNEFVKRIRDDEAEGNIDRHEAQDEYKHINAYNEAIRKLMKTANKIIKRPSKKLAYKSNVDAMICRQAYLDVPNPDFINKYQIGFYANKVLSNIYYTVSEYDVDLSRAKWNVFFREIFSEPNVVEVANYILLEGMSKIQDYKGSEVKEVWNDLTRFALDVLENSPEQIQSQMMDLYTKRVSRMFENNVSEIRTDLRNLDPEEYPHLSKVIAKYADKITEIIKEAANKAS